MYQVLFLFATVDEVECDSIEKDTSNRINIKYQPYTFSWHGEEPKS